MASTCNWHGECLSPRPYLSPPALIYVCSLSLDIYMPRNAQLCVSNEPSEKQFAALLALTVISESVFGERIF